MGIHLGGPIRGSSDVIFQPDIGTNTIGDVFTLTSSDGSVLIEGDALTDTIDFKTTAAQNAFKTVAGTAGTNPVADSATDTLSLLSSDSKLTITGDSVADSLDFTAPTLVAGPASATDNAIVRFDGTTGKLVQNSGVTIDDSNNVAVPSTATISNPGAGANSQKFGISSAAAGARSIAIGDTASASTADSIVIGYNTPTDAAATNSILIGSGILTGAGQGLRSVMIGKGSYHNHNDITGVGYGQSLRGRNSTAFGNSILMYTSDIDCTAIGSGISIQSARGMAFGTSANVAASGHTESIAFGHSAVTTAANQFVLGSGSQIITDVYLGQGVVSGTPSATIALNATGGSGTNIAGGGLVVAGGKATGNAAGGAISFHTSDAGASGTTLQTLTAKVTITAAGNVGIGTASPNSTLNTSGSWAVKRTAQAASANSGSETIIGVTNTAAARTITLRTADCVVGRVYIVKDESGAANTNNITIDTEGAELIDGQATVTITANYGVARVYSNGTDWFVI